MSTSTIPAAKAALLTLLTAGDYPQPVQVSYGEPRDKQRFAIVIGDTDGVLQQWAALGAKSRDEEYEIVVTVDMLHASADAQTATEEAYAVFAVVESILRANPRLGNLDHVVVAEIRQRGDTRTMLDEGDLVQVTGGVHVVARI